MLGEQGRADLQFKAPEIPWQLIYGPYERVRARSHVCFSAGHRAFSTIG